MAVTDDEEANESKVKTPSRPVSKNSAVVIAQFYVFCYSSCFWVQTAALPYLSKKLDVDPILFGYLRTTYGLMQLAGGPIYGRFGDVFGCRLAMTLAFVSSALSYFLTGLAFNVPILFLSRIPCLFMHGMQGGQMLVVDTVEKNERASALGVIGLSYGLGMIAGPIAGGWIVKYFSERAACMVAGVGCVLTIALVLTYIPSSTKSQSNHDTDDGKVLSWTKLRELLSIKNVLFLLLIKAMTGIPLGIFQSMISIVALETFQLTAEQNGYLMAYVGILGMLMQGFGVGVFTKRFPDSVILKLSVAVLLVPYLLLTSALTVSVLLVAIVPIVVSMTLISVVVSSALTQAVPDADTGSILGVNMGLNSLIRSVSPTVGGYMLAIYGAQSMGILGLLTNSLILLVLVIKYR